MQKIKNPILCWIVIFAIFIRPTPAQAMVPLAAVAVGGIIAATGVMVAGAGVYKPPTFAQANAAVDQVTGDITRKVIVARAFAEGISSGVRGYTSQYKLDYSKAKQWVQDHPIAFPALSPAFGKTTYPDYGSSPKIGDVWYDGAYKKVLTNVVTTAPFTEVTTARCETAYANNPLRFMGEVCTTTFYPTSLYWVNCVNNSNGMTYQTQYLTWANTTLPATVWPSVDDPTKLAPAYPNTEAGQDETDRIAAENPAAVKTSPPPFTLDQIKEASKQAMLEVLQQQAAAAEAAAAADPTNTALQVAAQEARNAAELAAVEVEAAKAELESKIEEPEKTDTPPPAGPALDQDLQIDFSPFLGLKDKAMGKFPFSAVSSLGSIFSGLTADPVTPSMDMPMPWGLPSAKISLSKWDDFAAKWRFLIAMMFHASCIYAIVRRYA